MRNKLLRIALAQINPTVGDLSANRDKIIDYINQAIAFESDLVVFPELALTGYPPEDLLLRKNFVEDNLKELNKITRSAKNIAVVLG